MKIICTEGRFSGTIENADEEQERYFTEKRSGGITAVYPKPLWKLVDSLQLPTTGLSVPVWEK